MDRIKNEPALLAGLASRTAIVTGAANGIGAQTARILNANGANVVIADLEFTRRAAEGLIASLSRPSKAMFVPVNILDWAQMKALFREAVERYGSVEIVVANAGMMESKGVFDLKNLDEEGDLRESTEGFRAIDVNLKGTMNSKVPPIAFQHLPSPQICLELQDTDTFLALRLALYHMQNNRPSFSDSSRGSIILVTSTSGYFGGTGVGGYVASKHGVTGLLRASQLVAKEIGVRVNAVAPFFTPTHITAGFAAQWEEAGLKSNTQADVASAITQLAMTPGTGRCYLIAGKMMREMEDTRMSLVSHWLGDDVSSLMESASKLFVDIGGYPLPNARPQ